jgi:hypothetical protein
MAGVTRVQCPACAANIADDGYSDVLTCVYCGTRVNVERPRATPSRPAPKQRTDADILRERLANEEREWDVRIRRAESVGGGDILWPLFTAVFVFIVLFIVAKAIDSTVSKSIFAPVLGCFFWIAGPLAGIVVFRLLARKRTKRALVVAGHRDEALAPLRARLAQLTKPAPLTEKERRLQQLQFERNEVKRRIDLAYQAPENERISGSHDMISIPAMGCGAFVLIFGLGLTLLFNSPQEYQDSNVWAGIAFVGPVVLLPFMVIVPLVWRAIARRARVKKLEAERDEWAPKLQQRLNELEDELARLTRS